MEDGIDLIITNLIGGLGNQLFQYAVARHLAHMHRTIVKVDISGFESYKLHDYSLSAFDIRHDIARVDDLRSIGVKKPGSLERYVRYFLGRPAEPVKNHIVEKMPFVFDPEILSLPDGVYLDGYWQSEKYFIDISGIIRSEFSVTTPQTGKNKEIAEKILSCDSVSLHVRRGDYITDPRTHALYGVCDLEYYFRGIDYIAERTNNPRFYIFSDDPVWAQKNLKSSHPTTIVSHNGPEKNFEDLRLMSQCSHHIIANSSFSWWGAWLNPSLSKIVVSPSYWMTIKEMPVDDLLPENWVRL